MQLASFVAVSLPDGRNYAVENEGEENAGLFFE
jgi:hypothetical protein